MPLTEDAIARLCAEMSDSNSDDDVYGPPKAPGDGNVAPTEEEEECEESSDVSSTDALLDEYDYDDEATRMCFLNANGVQRNGDPTAPPPPVVTMGPDTSSEACVTPDTARLTPPSIAVSDLSPATNRSIGGDGAARAAAAAAAADVGNSSGELSLGKATPGHGKDQTRRKSRLDAVAGAFRKRSIVLPGASGSAPGGAAAADPAQQEHCWYFAYGSNMNIAQLLHRIGPCEEKQVLALPSYTLNFSKRATLMKSPTPAVLAKAGFANVVPSADAGAVVLGIGYRLTAEQMASMDVFEGVQGGHYARVMLQCRALGGTTGERVTLAAIEASPLMSAWVYVSTPQCYCEDGLRPTEAYLSHLLAGRGQLPRWYMQPIESTAVISMRELQSFY